MKYKEMKFNIGDNPRASKAVQKMLFKLGYRWVDGKTIQYIDKPHLYTDRVGYLTQGNTPSHFDVQPQQEIDIQWMEPAKERKTVKVGDKRYYEDELAEALSKIKEVE